MIQSQSKWTTFAREILGISKELLFSTEALGVKNSVRDIPLFSIRQKLGNYEAFLNGNVENLQNEHGINLNNKPTFIESAIQQQMVQNGRAPGALMNTSESGIPQGSQYSNVPPGAMEQRMMGSINARAPDQSFDDEVNPIQQEL